MSAPSRRPEIRRRRTRHNSVVALRRRYAAAKDEGERTRIFARVKRLSPLMTLEEFTAPLQAKKG